MKTLDFHLESRPCPKCGAAMLYDEGEPWDGPTWGCTGCGHSENEAKAEPADAATMCVWCETRVGDACKSRYDTLTCTHRVIVPTAEEWDSAIEARAAEADTRKPCTCDGASRGPGRACVVKAGGRLGDLWRCSEGKAERVRALVNDGPWPEMSEAFDAHMGAACWTDPAYRQDAATWAAAWKAALRAKS